MIRRPPRSTLRPSSAASDVYKRQPPSLPVSPPSLTACISVTACISISYTTSCVCVNHFRYLIHHFRYLIRHLLHVFPPLPVCLQSSVTSYVQSSVTSCRHRYHFLSLRRSLCRLFIILMVVVSVAWVPIIKETSGGQVFIYINEVINYLAPPFAAIFLLAVLVPRVNEKVRIVCYTATSCCSSSSSSSSSSSNSAAFIVECNPTFQKSVEKCSPLSQYSL